MQKGEHFFRLIRTLPEDFIQILHVCRSKKILHFEKQLLLLQLVAVFTIRNSLASPPPPCAHSSLLICTRSTNSNTLPGAEN